MTSSAENFSVYRPMSDATAEKFPDELELILGNDCSKLGTFGVCLRRVLPVRSAQRLTSDVVWIGRIEWFRILTDPFLMIHLSITPYSRCHSTKSWSLAEQASITIIDPQFVHMALKQLSEERGLESPFTEQVDSGHHEPSSRDSWQVDSSVKV